ncbi:unnamed protein product [Trichogramma brassicae]|uniref:Uncharacterized protein n=1 Tax=Trichogramma brassicae TaxID=86971 RepID=A0A6H5IMU4_9HYME|nr:unnamed protein product [Trichogramma brassicae]
MGLGWELFIGFWEGIAYAGCIFTFKLVCVPVITEILLTLQEYGWFGREAQLEFVRTQDAREQAALRREAERRARMRRMWKLWGHLMGYPELTDDESDIEFTDSSSNSDSDSNSENDYIYFDERGNPIRADQRGDSRRRATTILAPCELRTYQSSTRASSQADSRLSIVTAMYSVRERKWPKCAAAAAVARLSLDGGELLYVRYTYTCNIHKQGRRRVLFGCLRAAAAVAVTGVLSVTHPPRLRAAAASSCSSARAKKDMWWCGRPRLYRATLSTRCSAVPLVDHLAECPSSTCATK